MKKLLFAIALISLPVVVQAQSSHSVTLTWTQSSTAGITGNNIYRATSAAGPFTKVFTSSTPISSYTDSSVAGSTAYYYSVTATCSTCSPIESPQSNVVVANVPADTQPPAPVLSLQSVK